MADIFIGDTYDSRYYDVAASQLGVDGLKTRSQEWMSQPRESSSDIVEILTYTFADRSPYPPSPSTCCRWARRCGCTTTTPPAPACRC